MRRTSIALVVAACFFLFAVVDEAAAQGRSDAPGATGQSGKPTYLLVPVKGTIGRAFTAAHMRHYLKQAVELKPAAVVLEVDSPGGSTAHAEKIVNLMIAHKDLRFVGLVRKALSAGAAVTLACREIYVTETATIGAAVSYPVDQSGIKTLPPDVAEKFQSVWRAVCRKAAERGGHPTILADAMIERKFNLYMQRQGDRVVFGRRGSGRRLKSYGQVLTLTAREAVDCGLAEGIVTDMGSLADTLGMPDWEQLKGQGPASVAEAKMTSGRLTPAALCGALSQKTASLNLLDPSLTIFQKQKALKEWDSWLKRRRLKSRHVQGTMTLVEAMLEESRTDVSALRKSLTKAEKGLRKERNRTRKVRKGIFVYERRVPGDPRVIRRLEAEIAKLNKELSRAAFPLKVFATADTDDRIWITAWASKSSMEALSEVSKGSEVRLAGIVADVGLWVSSAGNLVAWVELDRCKVPTAPAPRPMPPPRPPVRPKATPEQRAQTQLELAQTYKSAGMTAKARELLQSIIEYYPETKAAERARKEIERIDRQRKN